VRFLADMGLDVRVVDWLRDRGHDATHLRDEGPQRLPDAEIFANAIAEEWAWPQSPARRRVPTRHPRPHGTWTTRWAAP
jgi:Domain of unknown function (DUF5615)